MGPKYSIVSYWGPRPETPAAVADEYLRLLDALSKIHPAFSPWLFSDHEKGISLAGLGNVEVARLVAENVQRAEDGTPTPILGYSFGALNNIRVVLPHFIKLSCRVGNSAPVRYLCNSVILTTEPLEKENADLINFRVMRAALLAIAEVWRPTWCDAGPWGMPGPHAVDKGRPWFGLSWIAYLSARFAPMISPPASLITERLPDGALLMIATENTFDLDNPAHLAAARDIEATLAPVNALPWPPDAEPEG